MNWKKLLWHGLFAVNLVVGAGGWVWLQTSHLPPLLESNSNWQMLLRTVGNLAGGFAWMIFLFAMVLVARNPYFETIVAWSQKVWVHRTILFSTAVLLAIHVFVQVLGVMWRTDGSFSLETVNRFIKEYPSTRYALYAMGLFVPVIACAMWNWLKRFHFEWYIGIRMLIYPALILMFLHLFFGYWNRSMEGMDALYQLYSLGLSILTAGYFLFWRIVFPVFRLLRYHYRLDHVVEEQPGIVSWYIRGRHLAKMPYKPGQFFMVRPLTEGHFIENHPFFLSALPSSRNLRLTIAAAGDFTAEADQILERTALMLEGPFGSWTPDAAHYDYAILVGQGIALAGLRPLAEGLLCDDVRVRLICFVPEGEKLLFRDELEQLQKRWADQLELTIVEGATLSPQSLAAHKIAWRRSTVFLCGPDAGDEAVLDFIRSHGVRTKDLCLEPW